MDIMHGITRTLLYLVDPVYSEKWFIVTENCVLRENSAASTAAVATEK